MNLEAELVALLNRHCRENKSNTPDFVLAHFLILALEAFEEASQDRERWFGRALTIGGQDEAPWMGEPAPEDKETR